MRALLSILVLASLASGCLGVGAVDTEVHVSNSRREPVDVRVFLNNEEVVNGTVAEDGAGGVGIVGLLPTTTVQARLIANRFVVHLGDGTEHEAVLHLVRERHVHVSIGPEGVKIEALEHAPAWM